MAVDTNFASLFEKLKLEDPLLLHPRPWESIPSESGLSLSDASTSHSPLSRRGLSLYDTSIVSEASLVRLAMNALYGVESSLLSIEKLCSAFCCDPSDRTFHRIPSLWTRSSSTHALGNILKSIGFFGCVVFLLRKFLDHFTNFNFNAGNQNGVVNQAFSVAVGKVLEGYIGALDTLYASVVLRRSSKTVDGSSCSSSGVGCLTSTVYSEITLLEVYLHSLELRTQIGALGNICNVHDLALRFSVSSLQDLVTEANLQFCNFPRGGDLLTHLYTLLQVVDPVHCALLKFIFLRSCEPYFGFIRSWIYKAEINDPYKEFVVEYIDNPPPPGNSGISNDFLVATIRERDGAAVPCFLKDYLIPLFRAGQQLEVLMKLLELCNHVGTGNHVYDDILPRWSDFSNNRPYYESPLTFNKESIKAMVLERNKYYKMILEKLENFLTKLKIRSRQVVSCVNVPVLVDDNGGSLNIPSSFAMNDRLIYPSADRRDSNVVVETLDSETYSEVDELSQVEDLIESSECSSSNISEDENETEQLNQFPNGMVGPKQKYLSILSSLSSTPVDECFQKPSQSDMSYPVESNSHEVCERTDPLEHFIHFYHKRINLSDNSLLVGSGEPIFIQKLEIRDMDSQLLGGLVKNPFDGDRRSSDATRLDPFECALKVSNREMGALKKHMSYFSNIFLNDLTGEATNSDQLPNGTHASSNSFILQPWKSKYHSDFLSMNPLLSKNGLMSKLGEGCFADHRKLFSCFDFSSVEDPCKIYVEKVGLKHQFQPELTIIKNSGASAAIGVSNCHDEAAYNNSEVLLDWMALSHGNLPMESKNLKHEDEILVNVSGGSGWESILNRSDDYDTTKFSVRDQRKNLAAIYEIPLDFVIDKCLLQEILLQYKYVSKLAIKLLEEGFSLQEHLLALRRYHFMELADWADLFVMSLWRHKWYATEADHSISEIQGLLELSVQRSSCERDHNKDRLFVYTKGHSTMPLSTSAIGVHSFDFLGLGYRVDWPVSIILTPGALKLYAEIFSFLLQVKLAVFTLTEVWFSLKDLLHLVNQNRLSEQHKSELHHFNTLMKLRHQVNYFVSTLQQYVLSQLSHISWCRLLCSLKNKVKDMMDLESVHMSYLTDSLHIIIESILQCALDLRFCLIGGTREAEVPGGLSGKLSWINISQVLAIKGTFDKKMKELHLCYLNSSKHEEFGLSSFWGCLNFNEYYSDVKPVCFFG
ncbi:uncharacterized protein LOC132268306 isoform X2 [Cornus florida]|uniref:uncharacterized protein LOC132268306 isoform X2 n=1 Tax=Cornus florida TaxID=4283 RepID=UPI00289E47C7|nr:uncharacterized protein LOC132268306 isoform X2 [Cornus florida]